MYNNYHNDFRLHLLQHVRVLKLFGTILGCSMCSLGLALGGPGSSVELPGLLLGALGALCDHVKAPWGRLRGTLEALEAGVAVGSKLVESASF